GHLPRAAPDQHRDPGGHGHRVTARVRPGFHYRERESAQGPGAAVDLGDPEHRRRDPAHRLRLNPWRGPPGHLPGADLDLPVPGVPEGEAGMRTGSRAGRIASQVFLIVATLAWITPIVFAIYVALRPIEDTNRDGYVSLAHRLTLANFSNA